MPNISKRAAVATTVVVANVVSGDRFEFSPPGRITRLRGGIVGSATGLLATFSIGDRIISEDFIVPVEQAIGVIARDRDYNWVANAKPGERIVVSVSNPTGGSLTYTLLLELM